MISRRSSWIDPFVRYWCGISLSDDLKTLSFEPFSHEDFILRGVTVGGATYDFVQRGGVLTVVDASGRTLATGCGRVTLTSTGNCAARRHCMLIPDFYSRRKVRVLR